MERQIVASHARHWYLFNIHPFDSIFLVQNVFSSSRCFIQGLPEGFVLAQLLFLFYINNLASLLNDDAVIALFADAVLNLTAACKK